MDAATPIACALATSAPAFFSVRSVAARRPFAPLVRGSLERCCVLVAAGIAAGSLTAQIGCFAAVFSCCEDTFEALAGDAFFLFGPPTIAAATWCAGELLSGASARSEGALAAAAVAAYFAAVLAFGAALGARLPAGVALACAASASALAAAAAYLAVRGPTRAR
jgi:hypothetical protein